MEQTARAKELGLDTVYVGCKDCGRNANNGLQIDKMLNSLCTAPEIVEFTERGVGLLNAQACRDLKEMCGHEARWFVHKKPSVPQIPIVRSAA